MIVDELIARLGFKIEGIGEIKKFEDALKSAERGVSAFGKAMHTWLTAKMATGIVAAKGAFKGVSAALKAGVSSIALMVAKTAALGAGLATVVGMAGKVAYNFVKARGEAAALRREMQLTAKSQGTTAANVEKISRGLRGVGIADDDAKSFIGSLGGKIGEEAQKRLGQKSGKGKKDKDSVFQKYGIKALDSSGRQRGSSEVAIDVLRRYTELNKKYDEARRAETFAMEKGDKRGVDAAQRQQARTRAEADKYATDFGIKGQMKAALDDFKGGPEELLKIITSFVRANPATSAQEDEEAKERAKKWTELQNKVEGITKALSNVVDSVKDAITDRLLPAFNDLADSMIFWLKKLGIMKETREEVQGRKDATLGMRQSIAATTDIRKQADEVRDGQSFFDWLLGNTPAGKVGYATDAYDRARKAFEEDPANKGKETEFRESLEGLVNALREHEASKSPERIAADANRQAAADQRIYTNVGNDHRTITNNVTVNTTGGLEATGRAVGDAVGRLLGGATTKGANTSTGALTAP